MERITGPIISVCWLTFLLYWLVSASRVKSTAERQSLGSALAHRLPVGLGWYMILFPRFHMPFLNRPVIPHVDLALAVGAAICVLGLLFTIWARRTLAGNWSSDVTFKQGHELVRSGPYRFVRHPIYTGLLVMCLGTAIHIGQLRGFLGTVIVLIGFWLKLHQEEKLMLRHFPDQYPLYRKQVKALIPWVV